MNKNTLFLLAALFISFFLVFMPAYDELDRLRSACIRLEKKIRELALSAAALSAFGINNPETWLYKNESEILDLIRPL
ncbi:MAG TPA: hypothetical protein DC049_04205, partial [Spirochaetia bacterium]|nr:hypothetical protein [Spirochaetia bacterium]